MPIYKWYLFIHLLLLVLIIFISYFQLIDSFLMNCLLLFFLTGNNLEIGGHRDFDHNYCQDRAQQLMHTKNLPSECLKFQDIVSDLKRRDSDTTHPTQLLS